MKTWSERFEEGLNPFVEEFNSSIKFDFFLLGEDLDGSMAHAKMLGQTGIISSDEAKKIRQALEKIYLIISCNDDGFKYDKNNLFKISDNELIAMTTEHPYFITSV